MEEYRAASGVRVCGCNSELCWVCKVAGVCMEPCGAVFPWRSSGPAFTKLTCKTHYGCSLV